MNRMKTLQYMFFALLLLATASCGNDWLDLEPSTSVDTETSIKGLSEIEFTLNGIYSTMQSSDAYSGRLVYYGDVTGDDMQAVSSTKRTGNYYRFNFTKDSGPTSHWSYLYSIIQNCNIILLNIDKLSISDDDKEYRDDLKGQALAIRGLALFDLTRIFGYPYLKDNGASLGVPIVTGISTIDSKPSRNTVAQCYEAIIADLSSSVTLLGKEFNKGKINRWAAMTLLSRVYLYKGDNALALQMAEEAIAGAESNGYALWSTEEYPTAWGNDASAANPGEVLFEIVNLTTDSPGKESMGYLNSYDGYDDMCITCSFYHLLLEDPDDVRLQLLSFDKTYYAYVNKYQPQQGENITDANIPLLRLSEAYLNAAEAAVKVNDNDNVTKIWLRPVISGNYMINNSNYLSFYGAMGSVTPQMSMLNGATQYISEYEMMRGNPDLKTGTVLYGNISYSKYWNNVSLSAYVNYNGCLDIGNNWYTIEENKLISTFRNCGDWHSYNIGVNSVFQLFNKSLQLRLTAALENTNLPGYYDDKSHRPVFGANLFYSIGEFSFSGFYNTPKTSLNSDPMYTKEKCNYGLTATWNHRGLFVQLGCQRIFDVNGYNRSYYDYGCYKFDRRTVNNSIGQIAYIFRLLLLRGVRASGCRLTLPACPALDRSVGQGDRLYREYGSTGMALVRLCFSLCGQGQICYGGCTLSAARAVQNQPGRWEGPSGSLCSFRSLRGLPAGPDIPGRDASCSPRCCKTGDSRLLFPALRQKIRSCGSHLLAGLWTRGRLTAAGAARLRLFRFPLAPVLQFHRAIGGKHMICCRGLLVLSHWWGAHPDITGCLNFFPAYHVPPS